MTNIEVGRLFSASWCEAMVERLSASGFAAATPDYPTSYRTNERWVRDDPELAAQVFARARPHLPPSIVDEAGVRWRLVGLNPRMRACRYGAGQWFGVHRDGVHWASARERSWLSVLVYLDDGFVGGDTRVFADRRAETVVRRVVPERGKLAVFDHTLWHDGAPIDAGTKHVLRTDVMYARDDEIADGHLGYVWSLAALSDGVVASGGRDRSIRLWRDGACVGAAADAHAGSVSCLAAQGDGLVSGSRDRTVAWWRRTGEGLVRTRAVEAHAGAVLSVASGAAGEGASWREVAAGEGASREVVSAGADGALVWHRDAAPPLRLDAHQGWAWGVSALGEGRFASVGDDGRLVIAARGRALAAHVLPWGALRAVCAVGDGEVAVGALDGTIGVVRADDGAIVRAWRGHEGAVTALALVSRGRLASGGEDDRACLWALGQGRRLESRVHHDFVRAVCGLGARWVSAGYDGAVRFGEAPRPAPRTPAAESVIW